MFKPTMAAVVGLICFAAAAAEIGRFGSLGAANGGAQLGRASIDGGSDLIVSPGEDRFFAQVPSSHAAYGWSYPYAFHWKLSVLEHRLSASPANGRGEGP